MLELDIQRAQTSPTRLINHAGIQVTLNAKHGEKTLDNGLRISTWAGNMKDYAGVELR